MGALSGYWLVLVVGILAAIVFFFLLVFRGDISFGFLVWMFAAIFLGREFFFIQAPAGLPDIYLDRIVFVLLFAIFFIEIFTGRESLLPLTRLDYFMGLMILILLISMSRTGFLSVLPGEFQPFHIFLNGFVFPFSFYFLGKTILYTEKRVKILLWSLFVLFLYLTLTAFLEHYKVNSLIFPRYITDPLIGIHYGRARGPFYNAPVMGWMLVSLFLSTLFLRSQVQGLITKGFLSLVLLFSVVAIFFTYTRAVWLSILLAPTLVLVFSKRVLFQARFLLFPIILLLIFVSWNWENITSKERETGGVMQVAEAESRIALFRVTTAIFADRPLFGVGFARFDRAVSRYAPQVFPVSSASMPSQHNIFFGLLSEVGLIGLVLFLIILYYPIRYSIALFRELGEEGWINKDLMVIFWGTFLTFVVTASFIQTQHFLASNALIFLWVGMVVGLYQRRVLGIPDADNID